MEIPIEALALVDAASKDESRFMLGGVHFERNGGLRAVATDGTQLTRLTWRDASAPKENHEVTIRSDCLRRVKKLATKETRTISLAENNNYRREMRLNPGTDFLAVDPIDGKFPDTAWIFKDANDEMVYPASVEIDPFILLNQLKVIVAALRVTKKEHGHITMSVPAKGSHSAILLYGERGDLKVEAGVMPIVRNDDDDKKKK